MADQKATIAAISPKGYSVQLELSDSDTKVLMPRVLNALDWLESKGFVTSTASTPTAANGNGATCDTQVCPVHHIKMKRREKNGEVWHSHQAVNPETGQEYWCRGKGE